MKRIIIVMLSLLALSSCRNYGGGVVINPFPHLNNLPPTHAPAYGRRDRAQGYYYYPDSYVYFSPVRNVYFYLSDNQWKTSVTLPRSIRIGLGQHVTVQSYLDQPYKEHKKHKKTYKGKRGKGKAGKKRGRGEGRVGKYRGRDKDKPYDD